MKQKNKTDKKAVVKEESCCCSTNMPTCSCGAVYGLGFIGTGVYYISTATGFWAGVLGVLKAIAWPAFLVYNAFKFIGA